MADTRERHIVDLQIDSATLSKQLEQMDSKFKKVQGSTSAMEESFSFLSKGAVVATAAIGATVLAVKGVIAALKGMDSSISTINRINASSTNFQGSLEGIEDIASLTGSSLDEAGAAYQRLSIALDDYHMSAEQVLYVQQGLAKAVVASGASGEQAASGIMQFSQALSSGTLAGDELKSILENMPTIAKAVAQAAGVTTGELKKMGAAGKLNADVLLKSIDIMNQGIKDGHEPLMSYARATNNISLAWDKFLVGLENKFHIFSTINQWIYDLGELLENLGDIILNLGTYWDIFTLELQKGVAEFNQWSMEATGLTDAADKYQLQVDLLTDRIANLNSMIEFNKSQLASLAGVHRDTANAIKGTAAAMKELPNVDVATLPTPQAYLPIPGDLNTQLENLHRQLDSSYDASVKLNEQMALLKQGKDTGFIDADQYNDMVEMLNKTASIWDSLGSTINGVMDDAGSAVADFIMGAEGSFDDLIKSWTKSLLSSTLSSAFQSVANQFVKLLGGTGTADTGIFGSLMAAGGNLFKSANGNVFDQGRTLAFAKGGVVRRPTVFPMASGMGLMGEAGPEAVMPLSRDSQGRLGVAGGGTTVIVNNNAPGTTASASESQGPNGEKVIEVLVTKAVAKAFGSGALDKSMKANYDIARAGRR